MVLDTIKVDSSIRSFALIFVLLNVMDLVLTYWVLSLGGLEVNPIMQAWMDLGMLATIAIKVGSSLLVAGLLWHFRQRAALKLGSFFMLCVCLFNFTGLVSMAA